MKKAGQGQRVKGKGQDRFVPFPLTLFSLPPSYLLLTIANNKTTKRFRADIAKNSCDSVRKMGRIIY